MARGESPALSRRERQIMDSIFRRGSATASDVRSDLPDPPSYSAVRTMLARLEEKSYVAHRQVGRRYVYRPTIDAEKARQSALERLVDTFFNGSPGKMVVALLDRSSTDLTDAQLDDLAELIERMREERR